MSSVIAWMRVRMRRRSVSSLVSPGSARADAAAEPRQRVAGADQPRQQVFQLRELDLQLAFARPRAPREDVEDELRAIDDLAADRLFDLPQLRRRQLVVEDDDVDVGFGGRGRERLNLAGAEKRRRIRLRAAPAARAARPRRRRPGRGRPARRAIARLRAAARGRRSTRRARPARAAFTRASACVQPCLNLVPRNRAGAHQRRLGARSTSTIVDGGAAARRARHRSAESMRSPSVRSTSSGSAVAGSPLRLALVAVTGRPRRGADRPRHRVGRHAHADACRFRRSPRAPARAAPATSSVSGPGQKRSASRAADRATAARGASRPAPRRRRSAAARARRRVP